MDLITVFKIYLTPLHDVVLSNFTGTITSSIFLNLVKKIDLELSNQLHNLKTHKPYSVTPFFVDEKPVIGDKPIIVKQGSQIWFRVTIIGDLVFKILPIISEIFDQEIKLFQIGAKFVLHNVEVNMYELNTIPTSQIQAFKILFLTPTRFAIRKTMKRLRKPRFCFCPDAWRIIKSAYKHWYNFIN